MGSMECDKMKPKKIKMYSGLWYEWTRKPTYFEIGLVWISTIIFFPLQIWFYLIYKLIAEIGRALNRVKVDEVEREEEEKTYY